MRYQMLQQHPDYKRFQMEKTSWELSDTDLLFADEFFFQETTPPYHQDFFMKKIKGEQHAICQGEFFFGCSFNERLYADEKSVSVGLSSPIQVEEGLTPISEKENPSTRVSFSEPKVVLLSTQNQRQKIVSGKTDDLPRKPSPKSELVQKASRGRQQLIRQRQSGAGLRGKRDNNYIMKRAHTVLKRSCWAFRRELKAVTRVDADGSMDYFVRLLCRLQAMNCHSQVIEQFHREAEQEMEKVREEIRGAENRNEIQHLQNVIAVLLKGKDAADIFLGGQREEAMEIMYGKGQTLKKVYKLDMAISNLKTLVEELVSLRCFKNETIPDIGMI